MALERTAMKCEEFTRLLTGYFDGDLPTVEMALSIRHRAGCQDCDAYAASYESTIRLARDAFREIKPETVQPTAEALIARILERTVFASDPAD